ncbi:MAG: hypothetical protein M1840_005457 [Geoglossum simile]|nr:MAG: hypothetical protein M1840_005457 [Geoglossum simile]
MADFESGNPFPHDSDNDNNSSPPSLFRDDNPNAVITYAPERRFKLGYWSVMGLVVNRMIGSGIFITPGRVMQGTQSTGAAIVLWLAGAVYALAGTHVYIEYGLNVPRGIFNDVEQGVPRSGGDLNYLQYVYTHPAYCRETLLFFGCLFGISFIILGNMAGNAINFAIRILEAANVEVTNGAVRGIAVTASIFACFIHAFSRRGGIWLNNLLAVIKLCILVLIIFSAIIYSAGKFPKSETIDRGIVVGENLGAPKSFRNASSDANGYAQAFLAIVFAYSGFEQPNYVLGEIGRPHRKYPISMVTSVSLVCLLYLAVNISYMVVVPKSTQLNDISVAQSFFELTFGALSPTEKTGARIFSAFLAISSLGNIIVVTFTAARVKQEIAKEGMIPWPKFFAQNYDFSLGRVLRWARRTQATNRLLGMRWLAPENHSERTPVGTLLLHLVACTILLFATYGQQPRDAYYLLTSQTVYVINGCFGTLLAAGILYLRFTKKHNWRQKARKINPVLSVVSAAVYLIGNLFPIIVSWVKPSNALSKTLQWFVLPTVSWCVLAFAGLWWVGLVLVVKRTDRKTNTVFTVQKVPEFESDPPDGGPPVQVHETVYLSRVGRETLSSMGMTETADTEPAVLTWREANKSGTAGIL